MSEKKITIFTHNGHFHNDEVMGIAILLHLFSLDPNVRGEPEIVRTRDLDAYPKYSDHIYIYVDVGGVYDPKRLRFDHHQNDFHESYSESYDHPMASAGQVWKEYGTRLYGKEIADTVYDSIIANIDCLDNGWPELDTGVAFQISRLNAPWDSSSNNYQEFMKAINIARIFLEAEIETAKSLKKAKVRFHEYEKESTPPLLVLRKNIPWLKFISDYPDYRLVLFPRKDEAWGISTIRKYPNTKSFEARADLPDKWVENHPKDMGIVFVHKAKFFMAVDGTEEQAIEVANLALSQMS